METTRRKRKRTEQSSVTRLSAFAAAKARQRETLVPAKNIVNSDNALPASSDYASLEPITEPEDGLTLADSEEDNREVILSSQPVLATRNRRLCNWEPRQDSIVLNDDEKLQIRLKRGQTLAILGEYVFTVLQGLCFVYGATLGPGYSLPVSAPATHALPVIECLSAEGVELLIEQDRIHGSLRPLKQLSPLFSRIWNFRTKGELPPLPSVKDPRSFSIVCQSADDPYKRSLFPLEVNDEWRQVINKVSKEIQTDIMDELRALIICGPKSAGKSTLSRLIVNRILTARSPGFPHRSGEPLYYVDLDPGQPEFSVPGQVSLVSITEPIIGPPFNQAYNTASHVVIRSHTLAAITPADNPKHFIACALDLVARAEKEVNERVGEFAGPIIVNCPGWYMGTGADIVKELMHKIHEATDVITLTSAGWVAEDIASTAAAQGLRLHSLEPQVDAGSGSRTSAEFREMQMISYFHHYGPQGFHVDMNPISTWAPYEVPYVEGAHDFAGIMDYTEYPSMKFVKALLNGTIVALVEVEDSSALAGREATRENDIRIPFYMPGPDGYSEPLDPRKSHFIGLALIRSIDPERQTLHLITPLEEDVLAKTDPDKLVLVRGSFDTSGWAYKEDLYFQEEVVKQSRKKNVVDGWADLDSDDASAVRPWVKQMEGSERPGLMTASWRTRRFQ